MGLAALLQEVWALLGPKLRKTLLAILSASGVIVLVMFAWLFYSTGEMYRRFGVLPTKDEMVEQTERITDDMATKRDVQEVSYALENYQDSLGRLRTHFDTALIVPGLSAIVDLQKRMAQLERTGVETRIAVEEQKRQGAQNTEALIDQMNMQSSAEERAKEREQEREREQREADRRLMEAIAKKLRIDTKTF